MYRRCLVLVCFTLLVFDAPAADARTGRRGKCCKVQCSPCYSVAASQRDSSRVDPCICLKEELDTYPTSEGRESLYLAEKHDDGCPPHGYCQFPETIYVAGAPNQGPQECSLGECTNYRRSASSGLAKPVALDHKPKFAGKLAKSAQLIHTDYVMFQAPGRGWTPAIVYIVKLPLDPINRPGQPVRMVAYGFEVEAEDLPGTPFEVSHHYVRPTGNPHLFMLDCGGVSYAVVTAQ
jgi:hypothetical protein